MSRLDEAARAANKTGEVSYVLDAILGWLDFYLKGPAAAATEPAHDVRAATTRPYETPFDPRDVIEVSTYDGLATGHVAQDFPGVNVLTFTPGNTSGFRWDPVVLLTAQELGVNPPAPPRGRVVIITAGTSDLPVAREALVTAQALGSDASLLADVGVAGIHRLLRHREQFAGADVIVVVAGMDGALPSVVGGLVDCPVIAVPTSIGYGAAFGGLAPLLTMLNSCAAGVSVVNIDNGFGAGYLAALINGLAHNNQPD